MSAIDNENVQILTLDFNRPLVKSVRVKQYDKDTRFILVKFLKDGKPYPIIGDDYKCYIKMLTALNRAIFNDVTLNADGSALIELTEKMLTTAGLAKAELDVFKNDTIMSTMTFDILVSPSAYNDETIIETNEFGALNSAILAVDAMLNSDNFLHTDQLGAPNGVATLNEEGQIPSTQLPSYVDDVLEGTAVGVVVNNTTGSQSAAGFILTGETEECIPEDGKIYMDVETNVTYRWGGTVYVSIGSSLGLGTTSFTAFPGDRGLVLEEKTEKLSHAENILFDESASEGLGGTVQEAIDNLNKQNDLLEIKFNLLTSRWTGTSPYYQSVVVGDLSIYNNCSVAIAQDANKAQQMAIIAAEISDITYSAETGTLDFTAIGVVPAMNIPLVVTFGSALNIVEAPKYINGGGGGTGGASIATEVSYDNTFSGLNANNVQDALDEVVDDLTHITFDDISNIPVNVTNSLTYDEEATQETGIGLDCDTLQGHNTEYFESKNELLSNVESFLPTNATFNGIGRYVENGLLIDTSNPRGDLNKVGYINNESTGVPTELNFGIREVYYYNPSAVFVKITGLSTANQCKEWFTFYNGTTWTAWYATTMTSVGTK